MAPADDDEAAEVDGRGQDDGRRFEDEVAEELLSALGRFEERDDNGRCYKTFFSSLLILRVDKLGVSVTKNATFLTQSISNEEKNTI